MDMIFRRSQAAPSGLGRARFKLHCKIELNDEERSLITRYHFLDAVLIYLPQPTLFRNSALIGLLVFLISIPILALNFWYQIGMGWTGVVVIAAIIALAAAFIAYNQMRETIYVKDLIHGRNFKCVSVVELARKEAGLESICGYLRQVMEGAKHWGGDERREVMPLPPEEAKRFILSGPIF